MPEYRYPRPDRPLLQKKFPKAKRPRTVLIRGRSASELMYLTASAAKRYPCVVPFLWVVLDMEDMAAEL